MKYTFQWILAAVCLLVVGNAQVMADDKEDVKVNIPLITGGVVTGDDMRDLSTIPFISYYQGDTIYISTSAEFSSIDVSVVNETANQVWSSTTDISDGIGEIDITNACSGSYRIEIITEYGECFVGSFRL